jgi:signal transduction histidine kinase
VEISNANINIGTIYLEKGFYKKANLYYIDALKIKEEIGNKEGMSTALTALTSLNIKLAEIDSINSIQKTNYLNAAIEYGNKAIIIAREMGAMPNENKAAEMLMVAYNKLENYKKAMEFAEIYILTNDSLFNKSKVKSLQEIETKYETEKKNVRIKELQIKDIKNQNTKKTFIIIIVFLLLISILLIIFFRQKQKTNKLLNKKNYQLKKLNETQSRLMSIISHDLKAPLSAFFSITSSLKSKIDILDSTTIDNYFNRMLNSALAVKLQLENLLVWSINQSTDINVNNSNYNLLILTQKVIIILEEFAKEKSISLINNINEEIDISTDGRLLSIALNNIITNAIKFSSNNSEVELSALNNNNKIIISIKDTGIGISKSNLKTLFSGKENNSDNENKGTGLGLIVSKDIIEKLGGTIRAESKLNIGTTFYIELNE